MTDVERKLDDAAKQTAAERISRADEPIQRKQKPITNGFGNVTRPYRESSERRSGGVSPMKSPNKNESRSLSMSRVSDASSAASMDKKKVPMNKIQVGAAPSPNLKSVKSKIGSMENTTYKPGGGKVRIESRKLDFSKAQSRIAAKNDTYSPQGGDKKIQQQKLQWNAKSKIGSLENTTHKPGGGDKKIESMKLDFKDKAKPKVGSKDNEKHVPGGGAVKSSLKVQKSSNKQGNGSDIETQKIEIKAESRIGSLNNVKHKPGGGDKKIFDDKEYLRQMGLALPVEVGRRVQFRPTPITTATRKMD